MNLRIVSLLFLAAALVLAGFASCNLPPANEPKAIAEAFLVQLKNGEFKAAAEYSTDTAKQLLLLMDSLKENAPPEELSASKQKALKIGEVTVEGESARVKYTLGDDPEQVLDLVKVEGNWKVDFKKQV